MTKARRIWAFILLAIGGLAWFSGERVLYLSALVLVILPIASYIVTYFLLKYLRVFRTQPETVLKQAEGVLKARLHNNTFIPLGKVSVILQADDIAVEVLQNDSVYISPFGKESVEVKFKIKYRGFYNIGMSAVAVTDICGLFQLKRKFDAAKPVLSLPHVAEQSHFPLAMNLMTQAASRFDIRDEDYSTIADVRQYLPTDSIKRVHWKLTAKRNEWLVKTFQSNALTRVTVILDSTRLAPPSTETYEKEDKMAENALGLAKFCLGKGMPIDFFATSGEKVEARGIADFDLIYNAAAKMRFSEKPAYAAHYVLSRELDQATGYANAVILTGKPTPDLYERVINGINNGHYIAIMYFAPPPVSYVETEIPEPEKIYKLLGESGIACIRVH